MYMIYLLCAMHCIYNGTYAENAVLESITNSEKWCSCMCEGKAMWGGRYFMRSNEAKHTKLGNILLGDVVLSLSHVGIIKIEKHFPA
jgi:hypothetical protein